MNSAQKQKKPASGVVNAVVSGQRLVISKTKETKPPFLLVTGHRQLVTDSKTSTNGLVFLPQPIIISVPILFFHVSVLPLFR